MSKKSEKLEDPRKWVKTLDIESTEDIAVPKLLIDQVIGQEQGAEIVRKAAEQRRHVMLIGDPGTGKSMLARSISELLPKEELQDVLVTIIMKIIMSLELELFLLGKVKRSFKFKRHKQWLKKRNGQNHKCYLYLQL